MENEDEQRQQKKKKKRRGKVRCRPGTADRRWAKLEEAQRLDGGSL